MSSQPLDNVSNFVASLPEYIARAFSGKQAIVLTGTNEAAITIDASEVKSFLGCVQACIDFRNMIGDRPALFVICCENNTDNGMVYASSMNDSQRFMGDLATRFLCMLQQSEDPNDNFIVRAREVVSLGNGDDAFELLEDLLAVYDIHKATSDANQDAFEKSQASQEVNEMQPPEGYSWASFENATHAINPADGSIMEYHEPSMGRHGWLFLRKKQEEGGQA